MLTRFRTYLYRGNMFYDISSLILVMDSYVCESQHPRDEQSSRFAMWNVSVLLYNYHPNLIS